MPVYKTTSSRETKKIAASLAKKILKAQAKRKNALVLALVGDLGSGKTTFVQGFLRSLGIKKKITSPSFVLIKKFAIRANLRRYPRQSAFAYHIDCYRIRKPKELLNLGLKEILDNPKNIVLIEWPEKIRRLIAKNAIWLKFDYGEKSNQRTIKFPSK